jgi:hypothetical protein
VLIGNLKYQHQLGHRRNVKISAGLNAVQAELSY